MSQCNKKLIIAMLAAGGSRRFKGTKLAATLKSSQNAILLDTYLKLKRAADVINAGMNTDINLEMEVEVVVILGGHRAQLQPLLPESTHWVVNPDWEQGLSTSVRCAAQHAINSQASGLMLTLADQVAISAADYLELIYLWQQDKQTVASEYLEEPGVPAIFNGDDLAVFSRIKGDRGAKPVLMQYKAQGRLSMLSLDCGALDIDTRDDLNRWDLQ
ncbi:nucleotidyltransferase family protein [Shewanella surugensis]|uniref:Nucleotidyltransferase family protein n=1 Tax=Shewanella surugensis TaxID=212020 RepID=A0ABT0LDA0_9GAMM|nr:nucleotidyltransferase family protein [Shewanella surugensis]MCL1125290.1 nucleotidyltransferase family protein [Shewanella surugensis]